MQNAIAQKERGPENNGHRQVGGEIGFIPRSRHLIAGHADKDGNNAHRINQCEKPNEKFDIAGEISIAGSRCAPVQAELTGR